jgi:hypothetical protein
MFILVKSALRKPPQVQKSWGQPDRSISQSQYQVVQVRSSDHDMKDSLEGSQSKYSLYLPQENKLFSMIKELYFDID